MREFWVGKNSRKNPSLTASNKPITDYGCVQRSKRISPSCFVRRKSPNSFAKNLGETDIGIPVLPWHTRQRGERKERLSSSFQRRPPWCNGCNVRLAERTQVRVLPRCRCIILICLTDNVYFLSLSFSPPGLHRTRIFVSKMVKRKK